MRHSRMRSLEQHASLADALIDPNYYRVVPPLHGVVVADGLVAHALQHALHALDRAHHRLLHQAHHALGDALQHTSIFFVQLLVGLVEHASHTVSEAVDHAGGPPRHAVEDRERVVLLLRSRPPRLVQVLRAPALRVVRGRGRRRAEAEDAAEQAAAAAAPAVAL